MAEEKNTKKCAKCKEEIAGDAKKCKHCGADQRNWFIRHKILTGIFGLIVLGIIIGAANSGSNNQSAGVNKTGTATQKQEVKYKVGDVIKTDKLEITVTKAEERDSVGSDYFKKSPSQGGTFLAVQYNYKNISSNPVSSFDQPTVKLVDSKGTQYDSDAGITADYATELNLDTKILSDLNPGITVNNAEVFEISKTQYAEGSWDLIVHADKDYRVTIK